LVRQLSSKRVTKLFGEIENRVRAEVEGNEGVLLGWQGDGGIAVPTLRPRVPIPKGSSEFDNDGICTRLPVLLAECTFIAVNSTGF
jgi:hypothetical protein